MFLSLFTTQKDNAMKGNGKGDFRRAARETESHETEDPGPQAMGGSALTRSVRDAVRVG